MHENSKLNQVFVVDVVGNGTTNIVGLFETAQQRFYKGKVIPLRAGDFEEINQEFAQVINILTWEKATGDVGLTILPLVSTDQKGGAFPIMM